MRESFIVGTFYTATTTSAQNLTYLLGFWRVKGTPTALVRRQRRRRRKRRKKRKKRKRRVERRKRRQQMSARRRRSEKRATKGRGSSRLWKHQKTLQKQTRAAAAPAPAAAAMATMGRRKQRSGSTGARSDGGKSNYRVGVIAGES